MNTKTTLNPLFSLTTMIPWFQEALLEKPARFLHMHLFRSTTVYWIEKQQMIIISAVGESFDWSGFFFLQDV